MFDELITAIDNLLNFTAGEHKRDLRPQTDFLELLGLDQEVASLCQVMALPLPPITYEGNYGGDFAGVCKIPVSRYTEGIKIWQDRGWLIAMQGLRRTAELEKQRKQESSSGLTAAPTVLSESLNERLAKAAEKHRRLEGEERAKLREWLRQPAGPRLQDVLYGAINFSGGPDEDFVDFVKKWAGKFEIAAKVLAGFSELVSRILTESWGNPVEQDASECYRLMAKGGTWEAFLDLLLRIAEDDKWPQRVRQFRTGLARILDELLPNPGRHPPDEPTRVPNFSADKLDPSRCPGCKEPVPEEYSTLPKVPCLACGRWELDTGLIVSPVAGPEGTPPAIIRRSSPFWKARLPDRLGDGDNNGANRGPSADSDQKKHPPVALCPGCGSPPAATDVDDVCPQCGAYKFHCQLVRHVPLGDFPPIYQRVGRPFWERIPLSQVTPPGTKPGKEAEVSHQPENLQDEEAKLSPSRQKAFTQYVWAIRQNPVLKEETDQEVYDRLAEHLDQEETLPSFATWSRYLREARAINDANKSTVRSGRETGRSIVHPDDI